eukprot:597803_1
MSTTCTKTCKTNSTMLRFSTLTAVMFFVRFTFTHQSMHGNSSIGPEGYSSVTLRFDIKRKENIESMKIYVSSYEQISLMRYFDGGKSFVQTPILSQSKPYPTQSQISRTITSPRGSLGVVKKADLEGKTYDNNTIVYHISETDRDIFEDMDIEFIEGKNGQKVSVSENLPISLMFSDEYGNTSRKLIAFSMEQNITKVNDGCFYYCHDYFDCSNSGDDDAGKEIYAAWIKFRI